MNLDDAYANGKFIPNANSYPPRWQEAAQDWRMSENAAGRARVNLSYGPHERESFDLFLPSGRPKGLLVFVHGGYWHLFDKFTWSHLAAGAQAREWAVAIPSYPLAPEVTIPEITKSTKQAIEAAAQEVAGPIVLTGHSAGGHLVARMLCEDGLSPEVAARVQRVVPISPLSDLRPLLKTSMNAQLRLTEESARDESPVLHQQHYPTPVTVWVGAEERPAFLDQARWLVDAWPDATLRIDAGRHHFDVIDGLEAADSPLMKVLLD